MSTSFEPLAHSAEGIGPASLALKLPAFAAVARELPVTRVPQATADALASLSPQQRRLLERRLGLEKETDASSSALRVESHKVDFESWQRSRLLAGSDEDAAIANAQNVLFISQSHIAPEKLQARVRRERGRQKADGRRRRPRARSQRRSGARLDSRRRPSSTRASSCQCRPARRRLRPSASSGHRPIASRPACACTGACSSPI